MIYKIRNQSKKQEEEYMNKKENEIIERMLVC